jgi:hypothetical protein
MKLPPRALLIGKTLGLALAIAALGSVTTTNAQVITYALNSAPFANYASGFGQAATSASSVFEVQGTTTNNITGLTFGNNFTATASGAGAAISAWAYQGVSGGATIPIGTVLPIGYNFTLAKNGDVTGNVTWTLRIEDPSQGGSQHGENVATGTLSSNSASFSGFGSFTYASSVPTTTQFRANLEVSYMAANNSAMVTATMSNTGFGGGGITLNAIPSWVSRYGVGARQLDRHGAPKLRVGDCFRGSDELRCAPA